MGQNGFQRGPTGSKCGQQRVNLYQNALNWVPSCLKWHQHPLQWVKTGSRGSRGVPRGPNGSKWPQIPPNGLFQAKFAEVFTGEGPPSTRGWVELGLAGSSPAFFSGGYSPLLQNSQGGGFPKQPPKKSRLWRENFLSIGSVLKTQGGVAP